MDENDIVCWHWDHKEKRSVKGINVLSAFYVTKTKEGEPPLRLPIGYRVITKTEKYIDKKDNKEKRKSTKTKNELMQEMISSAITNRVKFGYILADSWFASSDNMRFISKHSKIFVFEMKENRLATLSEQSNKKATYQRLDQIQIPDKKPVAAWLKDVNIPILLYKQRFFARDTLSGNYSQAR